MTGKRLETSDVTSSALTSGNSNSNALETSPRAIKRVKTSPQPCVHTKDAAKIVTEEMEIDASASTNRNYTVACDDDAFAKAPSGAKIVAQDVSSKAVELEDEPQQDDATTADESTGQVASSASASVSASDSTSSSPFALMSSDSPDIGAACLGEVFVNALFPMLTEETQLCSDCVSDHIGQDWRVVWYPKGQPLNEECVSVCIEMLVNDSTNQIARVMDIEILVVRQDEQVDSNTLCSRHVHEFTATENRFGISKFLPRAVVLDPKSKLLSGNGFLHLQVRLRPHLNEDACSTADAAARPARSDDDHDATGLDPLITDADVDVDGDADEDADVGSIITPTTSSVTDQFMSYDSKEETSMVGLKNQGATCYMNSLLQTLFHLRAFRQMVYDTPTEQEDTNDSVSLALQRVFYRLQTQSKAVSTKELTRSFGWSQIDSFMQHDVQELYRILCDRLEEKMKGTKVDNAIKKLFEGKVRSFVQCVNVDFQSFRDESFYDLQLDVKGCRDIYQSFRKYVEIEMLQGDNQYEAEGYGKQDARKGVRFLKFPPVLNIQLKRFEYDPMRDGMVKIHDRFEFPTRLVLNDFFEQQNDSNQDATSSNDSTPAPSPSYVYHLHSVLVHSGDVHGGHYYVYIRPGKQLAGNTNWFKFDDDQISLVDERVAVEGSFGTLIPTPPPSQCHNQEPHSPPKYSSMGSPLASAGQSDALENAHINGDSGLGEQSASLEHTLDDDGQGAKELTHLHTDDNGTNGHNEDTHGELGPSKSSSSNSLMMPLGKNFSSAYMLVYIRDGVNDIDDLASASAPATATTTTTITAAVDGNIDELQENTEHDEVPIPQSLLERFHEEEKATARRKRLQQTEHLFMVVKIASDWSITKLKKITKSIDFSTFSNNMCLRVRIRRAATIRQLYQRIYRRTGIPLNRQRLWKVITRENRTHRPDTPLSEDSLDCPVELLFDEDSSSKSPVRLYLQILHPPSSVSSPCGVPKCRLNRFFLHEFTAPYRDEANDLTKPDQFDAGEEEEMEEDPARNVDNELGQKNLQVVIPPIEPREILLFVKHYDVKKPLKERLEYQGNLLINSRCTGAELAKYLHEALAIPFTKEILLYEEVHPLSVSEIEMDSSLEALGLQHGDIICYQFADEQIEAIEASELAYLDDGSEPREAKDDYDEKYPDVMSYFRYLLDRVEVTFQPWNCQGETIVVNLLYSNLYSEIIDAVARELGDAIPDKWHLRLYQHSTLTGTVKRTPLRHSEYANDGVTSLEDFLTEYSERSSTMYYEILTDPIMEIEAKKQVLVYFSGYDDVFVEPNAPKLSRRVELLLKPTATVRDLVAQVRTMFQLDDKISLRVCEVICGGTLISGLLSEASTLDSYWTCQANHYPNGDAIKQLFIECISEEELSVTKHEDLTQAPSVSKVRLIAVNHFSYHTNTFVWIHTHGIPFVVHFEESESAAQVLERMRQRIGVSNDSFCRWDLAFVKDGKAVSVRDVFDGEDWVANSMQAVWDKGLGNIRSSGELDSTPTFQSLQCFGLEHPNAIPITPKYSRRQEQGIKIRQS